MTEVAAIILTGGRGERLGGVQKALITVEGAPLIEHAIGAARAAGAEQIVIVGDPVVGAGIVDDSGVVVVREDPPFGGPLAGLEAGLANVDSEWVLLLAGDLPNAREAVVELRDSVQTVTADGAVDGVCFIDSEGFPQRLTGQYRTDALRRKLAEVNETQGGTAGKPLRLAFHGLEIVTIPDTQGLTRDIDTPEDLDAAGGTLPPE